MEVLRPYISCFKTFSLLMVPSPTGRSLELFPRPLTDPVPEPGYTLNRWMIARACPKPDIGNWACTKVQSHAPYYFAPFICYRSHRRIFADGSNKNPSV